MRWGPFRATQSPGRKKERESPGLTLGSAVVPGEQGCSLEGVPRGSRGPVVWPVGTQEQDVFATPSSGHLRPDSVELGAGPQARALFSVKEKRVYSLT